MSGPREPPDEINPYRAPESGPGRADAPGRFRPALTVARVLVALWALFILAGPPRHAPMVDSRLADLAAKGLGALLFLLAVFPFRRRAETPAVAREGASEEL